MRPLLPAIFAITMPLVINCAATCEPLKATISIDRQLPSAESEAPVPSSPAPEQWQLDAAETRRLLRQQAGVQSQAAMPDTYLSQSQQPQPPSWMRGRVYTNDSLKSLYYGTHPLLPIPFPISMPEDESSPRLGPNCVSHWWGYKPPQPCVVTMVPYGPRGNYKFWHSDPNGPAGYIQYNGRNKLGYVKTRYWFIDRNQEPGREFVRGNAYMEASQDQARNQHENQQKQQQERDRQYQDQLRQYQELYRQVAGQGR